MMVQTGKRQVRKEWQVKEGQVEGVRRTLMEPWKRQDERQVELQGVSTGPWGGWALIREQSPSQHRALGRLGLRTRTESLTAQGPGEAGPPYEDRGLVAPPESTGSYPVHLPAAT
ncbi:unnamed protein product [Merluccius merluccius]